MERLVILLLIAFVVLALDTSEASLLPIGRSRTKKLRDRTTTGPPYVCLDPPIDLPNCNFPSEDDEKTQKPLRFKRALAQSGSLNPLEDNKELSVRESAERRYTRALTIIYKIEGCIPSRLPFVLPLCEEKDSKGRIIEVRRLFPFKVMGNSKQDPGVPLVFPELDMKEWHRFMKGPWTRPVKNEDDAQVGKTNAKVTEDEKSQVPMLKMPKRKKFEHDEENEKIALLRESKNIDENDLLPKFSMSSLENYDDIEHEKTKDRGDEINFHQRRSIQVNRAIGENERVNGKNDQLINEKISTIYRHEFPYDKAIPYDSKKLRTARVGSEFPYKHAIPYDQKKLYAAGIEREFPYIRAISYDRENLSVAKLRSQFLYKRAISYDQENLETPKLGSEFPYAHAISYDPKKLRTANLENVFPRTRAISYDREKLQTTKRGSEFPYERAIPYDEKKLESRKSEMMDTSFPFYARSLKFLETREKNIPVGPPFDTSMLPAAKNYGAYPYAKELSDVRSKMETMILPRTREPEKIKLPVRQVMTRWNRNVTIFSKKIQITNDTGVPNTVNNEKDNDEASVANDGSKVSSESSRDVRSVIESSTSDASSLSENHEIPRR